MDLNFAKTFLSKKIFLDLFCNFVRLKTSDKDFVEKLQNSNISNKNVAVNNVKKNFKICLK